MIRGRKISIRKTSIIDIQIIYNWLSDPEVYSLTSNSFYFKTIDEIKRTLISQTGITLYFTITHKVTNTLIGLVILHNINWINRIAEFTILIGEKEYQNRTYGIEIYSVFFDYVFNCLNLRKVYGYISENNKRSIRLVEFFGATREGVLTQFLYLNGKFYDRYIYSIFREKYKKDLEKIAKKYLAT